MKKIFFTLTILSAVLAGACNAPMTTTSGGNMTSRDANARNWVMIMHGESCGSADDVANNMYVENSHETSTITVTVDISWTENGQPKHENKTLSVGPNSKTLIGCDLRNGQYLKMEIVNAVFN